MRPTLALPVLSFLLASVHAASAQHATMSDVAVIDSEAKFTLLSANNGALNFSHELNEVGSVVGGGLDFKVLPKVSVGAEGFYYSFANDEARLSAVGEPFLFHDYPNLSVARARLTYYFNSGY